MNLFKVREIVWLSIFFKEIDDGVEFFILVDIVWNRNCASRSRVEDGSYLWGCKILKFC